MAITPEHEKKAQEWTENRNIACVCCGERHLSFDGPFTPVFAQDGIILSPREIQPLVAMFCHECGHVSFFSAVVMGLVRGALVLVE